MFSRVNVSLGFSTDKTASLNMNQRLTPATFLLLVIPTFLWAGNAVVGRLVAASIPPVTLNFFRWSLAFVLLLFFAREVLAPKSALWKHWRYYLKLGLLGVGLYNALQYMALHSSSPINVTLVGSSMPIWMLIIGRLFFHAGINLHQLFGALLSLCGVLIILTRGDFGQLLSLQFVAGDLYMLLATIAWAFYSWLLSLAKDPPSIKGNWARTLLAQVVFGVFWSGLFAAGEWVVIDAKIEWSPWLVLAIIYVAVGPAVIAFRCWGEGVRRIGPAMAGFFANLIPLFAALLSTIFLGESPRLFHAIAFVLIVGGIVYSSRFSPGARRD